jgi:hypothetical protein
MKIYIKIAPTTNKQQHQTNNNTKQTKNMKLTKQLQELESYISKHETTNTNVSSATVGWQIAHSFKVILYIMNSLEKSDPKAYKNKFNLAKIIIFWRGKIPRGRGNAPRIVRPKEEELSMEGIKQQFAQIQEGLVMLAQLPSNAYFTHPYFDDLQKKDAIRFMEIHTDHHLKIIRDMLR